MGEQQDADEEALRGYHELREKAGQSLEQCQFLSAFRLYGEIRRYSRDRGIAEGYVVGTFHQMDTAQNVLDFKTMRERAIELVALLEDDQRLLRIQGDFPREHFEYFVRTMSTCAYENLAEATGQLDGFNSDGLHACIADGLRVCRTTGKLRCVNCFREYACDVYMAADDAEIAAHQCRLVVDHQGPWTDRGDRRWLALGKLAWVTTLSGRLEEALPLVDRSLELTGAEGVTIKLESRLRALLLRDTVRILAGMETELEQDSAFAKLPAFEEYPGLGLACEWNRALRDVRDGRFDSARETLERWDRTLTRAESSHLWFENRLRLVALNQLRGERDRAEALARPLEQRALKANDFLTLRRLRETLESEAPSPIGMALRPRTARSTGKALTTSELSEAPEALAASADGHAGTESTDTESTDANAAVANSANVADPIPEQGPVPPAQDSRPETPLREYLESVGERLRAWAESPEGGSLVPLRTELLAVDKARVTHPDDAAALMHLMGFLLEEAENGLEIWEWANGLAKPHPDDPGVLSQLGTIGDVLRELPTAGMTDKIPVERTEPLFRRSLEIDQTRAGNYMRAGDHFLRREMAGEAERCYARAWRLKRGEGMIARRLAELYGRTDRPRDALHVLDVCLREGSNDPQVAHDAAMQAFALKQWDGTLTYLARLEEQVGERPWTNYYRALCHYETGEYDKALAATEAEIRIVEGSPWPLKLLLGLSRARLGDRDLARSHFEAVLATPLSTFPYLSPLGMLELLERMRVVAETVLKDKPLMQQVEFRQLRSGLMPETWFESLRETSPEEEAENVFLFRCFVRQPVGDAWQDDPGRLPHQEGWTSYIAEWGVLAEDADDALLRAAGMQLQCHDLSPENLRADQEQGPFRDKPGVVWQGGRFRESSDDEDEFA